MYTRPKEFNKLVTLTWQPQECGAFSGQFYIKPETDVEGEFEVWCCHNRKIMTVDGKYMKDKYTNSA